MKKEKIKKKNTFKLKVQLFKKPIKSKKLKQNSVHEKKFSLYEASTLPNQNKIIKHKSNIFKIDKLSISNSFY